MRGREKEKKRERSVDGSLTRDERRKKRIRRRKSKN